MPMNAVSTHAKALCLMKYAVKTIHEISESNYQGTPFECLFGTGQGSGASSTVWLTLVVILLNTIERLTPECMHFQSPSGHITHSCLANDFVDDTSLGFTDYGETTYPAFALPYGAISLAYVAASLVLSSATFSSKKRRLAYNSRVTTRLVSYR
jgi:hypothetical protein